eukprot:2708437-Prymnesium_polylepis.1
MRSARTLELSGSLKIMSSAMSRLLSSKSPSSERDAFEMMVSTPLIWPRMSVSNEPPKISRTVLTWVPT